MLSLKHLSLLVLAAITFASRPSPIRLHEEISSRPVGWVKRDGLRPDVVLPLKFGLRQSNIDNLESMLMRVASPSSPHYGQHLSSDEVVNTFAPSRETVDVVSSWLISTGVKAERISQSSNKLWLLLDATVEETERLLHTKYSLFEHDVTGAVHVACERYHLPDLVSAHVDLVLPTIHFDQPVRPKARVLRPIATTPRPAADPDKEAFSRTQLDRCSNAITPACLQALYAIPEDRSAFIADDNSFGVPEFGNIFQFKDFDRFARNFSQDAVGYRPEVLNIDGADFPQNLSNIDALDFSIEANLDLQYAIALTHPTPVILYNAQLNDSFNNFLDAIDSSYCTFKGGDDPRFDASTNASSDAFVPSITPCGSYKRANVIAVSYGYNEAVFPPAYFQRQCDEFGKLGLMGTSMVFASGDDGVAGAQGVCIDGKNFTDTGSRAGRFNPGFPSGCPYVTSVGATQINPGNAIDDPEVAATAVQSTFFSGGGFSDVFKMPSYQADAVGSYLKENPPPYTSATYNDSGNARAFPDISANGNNYTVSVGGEFVLVGGTSASAPTVAAILTLINGARLKAGKGTVGFVNPVLYEHPEAFNDIDVGSNPGCGTPGFQAAAGWDPVTGLGTPRFQKLLEIFMDLP